MVFSNASRTSGRRAGPFQRRTKHPRFWVATVAVALLGAGGLIFDAATPREVTVGAFYVGMVLLGFWYPQQKAALGLALLSTPLVILGHWISIPSGAPAWLSWMNRSVALGGVWLTAIFVWRIRVLVDLTSSLSGEVTWLASIVELSSDAIYSTNLDRVVTSWNNGAERIFGYPSEEVIGKPITILIPPERHHEENLIFRRILGDDRVDPYETIRRRNDGSLINIAVTISPMRDADGKVVGASMISRDITGRKRREAQISVLAREAEHRAKNLLANVKAIVRLSQSDTPGGLKEVIEGRISALADVHALFVQSRWAGAELDRLVKQELSPYSREGEERTRIDGPMVTLKPDAAQAVAVALHELATNAAKYGALSVAKGQVHVEWSHATNGRLVLRWTEVGGPPVSPPMRKGFGTHAMEAIMRGHLGGDVQLDWRAEGLVCEIALPT
jgi:PAS domain S-box-containing protein